MNCIYYYSKVESVYDNQAIRKVVRPSLPFRLKRGSAENVLNKCMKYVSKKYECSTKNYDFANTRSMYNKDVFSEKNGGLF